ncbi:Zinc/iron permease [Fimicolochytrium jonesii]|uniref:Zinc/iron permease n=1 Tax=Fimicolochytrium jonesii TaxID=1396493 RepID=UPI0022FEB6D2|nr:Zinc/iron permease [Fimicolochytrium jonesii]KAI8817254.1 Zinc/iron permease [Fimicolochytrium jonesii]
MGSTDPSDPIAAPDACSADFEGDYSLTLHVAAVFILMGVSFTGTVLPIIGKKYCNMNFGDLPFQSLKLFGAGVILATALVHMYSPAQSTLTSPCLPQVFQDYGSWAGVIALVGMFFTHLVQVVGISILRRRHMLPSLPTSDDSKPRPTSTRSGLETSIPGGQGDMDIEVHSIHSHSPAHADRAHFHSFVLADAEKTLTTHILEAGIASHSIIVGLTLGVARAEFGSVLVALCFHQLFEGLALSTVVMDANFEKRAMAFGMVTFYSLTTPVGIALGIGLRETFNDSATSTLIVIGVLDSLSAGILLYDGLVNIVVPHFASERFKMGSAKQSLVQFLVMWLGAGVMALIGRWA